MLGTASTGGKHQHANLESMVAERPAPGERCAVTWPHGEYAATYLDGSLVVKAFAQVTGIETRCCRLDS